MHSLFLTTAFLLIIASLVAGKISRGLHDSLLTHLHHSYTKFESSLTSEREASLLYEIKKRKEEGESTPDISDPAKPLPRPKIPSTLKSRPLDINLARPPDNAFLNLNDLENPDTYIIADKLLRNLYPHSSYPAVFLTALSHKKQQLSVLKSLDDLSTLVFETQEEQEAVGALLKGYIDPDGKARPSILDYACLLPKHDTINFLFAPEKLLEVIIDHPDALKRALATRAFFWEFILDQEEHRLERRKEECYSRSDLKKRIKEDITSIFKRYHLVEKDFDFSLGQQGSFLIVTDPHTKMRVREKVSSQ